MDAVEIRHIQEKLRQLDAQVADLEFRSLRFRAQARGFEKQADDLDMEASAYLTARNALSLLIKEQDARNAEAKTSQEN